MVEKRFYWLKLDEGFFRQKEIKKLRKLAGGDTFTIIYLKLLLRSLENNGVLYYEGIEPTFAEELALDIDEDEENVNVTLNYLQSRGILIEKSKDEVLLITCAEMTGSESDSARRMRNKRIRDEAIEKKAIECSERHNVTDDRNKVTDERHNVQSCDSNVRKCYTEKEKELEKELDIETEKKREKEVDTENKKHIVGKPDCPRPDYTEIIDYLNRKAGTAYKATTKKTQSCINARLAEGFTVDDFKIVIDKKVIEWTGTEWEKFLRPETLFGTKFESYLNATVRNTTRQGRKETYSQSGQPGRLDWIDNIDWSDIDDNQGI